MTTPRTAAGRALLNWIAQTEIVADPAGNTIYDELRLNFLPRIEAEAAQLWREALAGLVASVSEVPWEDDDGEATAYLVVHPDPLAKARVLLNDKEPE